MGKRNGGFSLIETLVSIVILGAMVVPTCTALVMTVKLNDKTEKMLQAQLAVSSAVETLMAEGIAEASDDYEKDRFSDVTVKTKVVEDMPYYEVVVSSDDGEVTVTTTIRAADTTTEPDQGNGGGGE